MLGGSWEDGGASRDRKTQEAVARVCQHCEALSLLWHLLPCGLRATLLATLPPARGERCHPLSPCPLSGSSGRTGAVSTNLSPVDLDLNSVGCWGLRHCMQGVSSTHKGRSPAGQARGPGCPALQEQDVGSPCSSISLTQGGTAEFHLTSPPGQVDRHGSGRAPCSVASSPSPRCCV